MSTHTAARVAIAINDGASRVKAVEVAGGKFVHERGGGFWYEFPDRSRLCMSDRIAVALPPLDAAVWLQLSPRGRAGWTAPPDLEKPE